MAGRGYIARELGLDVTAQLQNTLVKKKKPGRKTVTFDGEKEQTKQPSTGILKQSKNTNTSTAKPPPRRSDPRVSWETFVDQAVMRVQNRLQGQGVTEGFMELIKGLLDTQKYAAVVEERAATLQCGYPMCRDKIKNFDLEEKTYRVSLKDQRIYETTEEKLFCGMECHRASTKYDSQLTNSNIYVTHYKTVPVLLRLFPQLSLSDLKDINNLITITQSDLDKKKKIVAAAPVGIIVKNSQPNPKPVQATVSANSDSKQTSKQEKKTEITRGNLKQQPDLKKEIKKRIVNKETKEVNEADLWKQFDAAKQEQSDTQTDSTSKNVEEDSEEEEEEEESEYESEYSNEYDDGMEYLKNGLDVMLSNLPVYCQVTEAVSEWCGPTTSTRLKNKEVIISTSEPTKDYNNPKYDYPMQVTEEENDAAEKQENETTMGINSGTEQDINTMRTFAIQQLESITSDVIMLLPKFSVPSTELMAWLQQVYETLQPKSTVLTLSHRSLIALSLLFVRYHSPHLENHISEVLQSFGVDVTEVSELFGSLETFN